MVGGSMFERPPGDIFHPARRHCTYGEDAERNDGLRAILRGILGHSTHGNLECGLLSLTAQQSFEEILVLLPQVLRLLRTFK